MRLFILFFYIKEVSKVGIKEKISKFKNNYVINQVKNAKIPEFSENTDIIRKRMTFSGKVQNIGFRLEFSELARRLGLTGFCENLENGDVFAEVQGSKEKIDFLVSFMESLKRIRITNKITEDIDVNSDEKEFAFNK